MYDYPISILLFASVEALSRSKKPSSLLYPLVIPIIGSESSSYMLSLFLTSCDAMCCTTYACMSYAMNSIPISPNQNQNQICIRITTLGIKYAMLARSLPNTPPRPLSRLIKGLPQATTLTSHPAITLHS